MRLNLNDIVGRPGAKKPFAFSLDVQDTDSCQMHAPFAVSGQVANIAGALELTGTIAVSMTCTCDRCAIPFTVEHDLPVIAHLAETLTDEEHTEIFLLDGGAIDLDEVCNTAFVLDMDPKVICRDDCAGLCISCGANLNEGSCNCKREVDPRLAALQQFFDKE